MVWIWIPIQGIGVANGGHHVDRYCHQVEELKTIFCILQVVKIWRFQGRKCLVWPTPLSIKDLSMKVGKMVGWSAWYV